MGMNQPIVHGMHTVAKVCALHQQARTTTITKVNCQFRGIVALGSSVVLLSDIASGTFTVLSGLSTAVQGGIDMA